MISTGRAHDPIREKGLNETPNLSAPHYMTELGLPKGEGEKLW